MKISLAQIDLKFGNPKANFTAVKDAVEKAKDSDVVVLPEMWNTGYALNHLNDLADSDKEIERQMSIIAKNLKINIVAGSISVKRDNKFYNEMLIFNRKGDLLSRYDKVHLFKLMSEDKYLTAGASENIFYIDEVPSMGVICYDIRFPEWIRKQASTGAQIIFVSAEWPSERIQQWRILLQARAIENQAFVVAVNRVGSDQDNEFGGDSMIINPLGKILVEGDDQESILRADIDLNEITKVRGQIPVFEDRRTELY